MMNWHPLFLKELEQSGKVQYHLTQVGQRIAEQVAGAMSEGQSDDQAEHDALREHVHRGPEICRQRGGHRPLERDRSPEPRRQNNRSEGG